MSKILVLGAGKIGRTVAKLLSRTGDYDVTVADSDATALAVVQQKAPLARAVSLDVADGAALRSALRGSDAVLSALSFHYNPAVAEAAVDARVSYFDLTEDVETTRRVRIAADRAVDGQ